MIIKTFEIGKKKLNKESIFLVYGENDGLKFEVIKTIKEKLIGNVENFEETQILNNIDLFYEKIFNQSLFEKEKIVVINRCTDKIIEFINVIFKKNLSDIKIILNANILEKKSRLRKLFEENKELIIVPTYKDFLTLAEIEKFFYNYKISISQETINLLVNRCNGDRGFKVWVDKFNLYPR